MRSHGCFDGGFGAADDSGYLPGGHAGVGFLIVILERIIAELSPPGEGTAPILNHSP